MALSLALALGIEPYPPRALLGLSPQQQVLLPYPSRARELVMALLLALAQRAQIFLAQAQGATLLLVLVLELVTFLVRARATVSFLVRELARGPPTSKQALVQAMVVLAWELVPFRVRAQASAALLVQALARGLPTSKQAQVLAMALMVLVPLPLQGLGLGRLALDPNSKAIASEGAHCETCWF